MNCDVFILIVEAVTNFNRDVKSNEVLEKHYSV